MGYFLNTCTQTQIQIHTQIPTAHLIAVRKRWITLSVTQLKEDAGLELDVDPHGKD